ncbi:MAG: hypothetical protein H0V04_02875 [Chloroflexi bacterium]|nr:hypothetical protein [Chloroflexota bacterium]
MPPGRRSLRPLIAVTLAITALGAAGPAVSAGDTTPSVRLISPSDSVTIKRYGPKAYLDPGILVAAVRGAFDLRVSRPDYGAPIEVWQYVDGKPFRKLPGDITRGFDGLKRFFRISLTDADGQVVLDTSKSFCPSGQDMRVNASGPMTSSYPRYCGSFSAAGAFVLGNVWGIERGWAVPAFGWRAPTFGGPDGRYSLRVAITPRFRQILRVDADDAAVRVAVRIKTADDQCPDCPHPGLADDGTRGPRGFAADQPVRGPSGVAPNAVPPAGKLPDLVALPAFEIRMNGRGARDRIEFGANIWNAGPSPMLVEGFRRQNEDVMDAFQYFFDGDEVLGRRRVGTMEFHSGGGHRHWHFLQFARYSLLDANGESVGVSRKQAFCLAPTDAIDLTVPGAEWQPGSTGLGTSCGGPDAVWVRETLQAGWGDTYYQVSGQSLDVTNLPNGRYYVAVEANPTGLLYESDTTNNIELRAIDLGGTPGDRTVTVRPWHGIDA